MTKTDLTPEAKGTQAASGIDLERLTQKQVAWLLHKSTAWVRDNPHRTGLNSDTKSYNGRELLQALRGDYQPVELSDSELEPLLTFAYEATARWEDSLGQLLHILEGIRDRHGAPGLAAIGKVLLEQAKAVYERFGPPRRVTPEEIMQRAQAEIAELDNRPGACSLLTVERCQGCKKYRWGRTWIEGDPPEPYGEATGSCPSCDLI